MENLSAILGTFAGVAIAAIIVGGMAYSCSEVRTAYYDAQKNCMSVGGSWVPHGGGNYDASCVYGRSTQLPSR